MRALPAKNAVWWIVVRGRWLNTAAVWAILLILLGIYLVLRQVDVPDSGAALWAPAAAALVAVLLLWRAARTSEAPVPQPVRGSKLAYRVFALIVLTYLGGAVVSGFVGAFVPAAAPGSAPDHTVAIQLRLSTTVQLPVALILSLGVGRLSATWLAVRRPLRWLALVAVTPTLFTVALHPVVVALARYPDVTRPRDLVETAPRTVAVTVLVYCALALGNLGGRTSGANRPTRPRRGRGRFSRNQHPTTPDPVTPHS